MKQTTRNLTLAVMLLTLQALTGCSEAEKQFDYTQAQQLFHTHCGACHGPDGKGKYYRGIPAAVLTDKTIEGVVTQIRVGSESHKKIKMRPLEHISEEDAILIARFLLHEKTRLDPGIIETEHLLLPGELPE